MKAPAAKLLAVAAITAVALSGCVRIQADTAIGSDDTFSQHVIVAFTDAVASQVGEQAGLNVDDLTDSLADSQEFTDLQDKYPGKVTLEDYSDEDLHGVELTITDLPLSEFNGAASQVTAGVGATASIDHVDGEYIVTMAAADGGEGAPGVGDGALGGIDLDALGLSGANVAALGSAIEFEVSYTFPGLVTEASAGDINGNTVTLGVADVVGGSDIRIVGGDSKQIDWWPFIKWALVIGAFASVIGGATMLVRQDKRRQRSNTLPPPVLDGAPRGDDATAPAAPEDKPDAGSPQP
ncbi:LppM family (lipo)protein [Demequina aurantiaca]|uniref:LppM family (lipo)protein n=1 Tax=Demequina aurantiaca TaxID=676200 RepID=UPI003D332739